MSVALLSLSQPQALKLYDFRGQFELGPSKVVDLKFGEFRDSGLCISEVNEATWIPGIDSGIIYINDTDEEVPGVVTLWTGDINEPSLSKLAASLNIQYSLQRPEGC